MTYEFTAIATGSTWTVTYRKGADDKRAEQHAQAFGATWRRI